MRVRTPCCASLLFVAGAALTVFPGGCSRDGGSRALEAAVVPGADLSGELDYRAVLNAPLVEKNRQGGPGGRGYAAAAGEENLRGLEEAMGIKREDLALIRFSADLDGLDPASGLGKGQFEKIDAVAALVFDRTLTEEQVEAGARFVARTRLPASYVTRATLEGRTVFSVGPATARQPALHAALARDGRAVFLALTAESLRGAFGREEGEGVPLSEDLQRAASGLAGEPQLRAALVVPAPIQRMIREGIAEAEEKASKNPGLGMFLGIITPFRDLSSLSLGTRLDEGVEVGLAADLGSEGQALQAVALLQTVFVPMIKARIARQTGATIADMDGKVAVGSRGAAVSITLRIGASDLEALKI